MALGKVVGVAVEVGVGSSVGGRCQMCVRDGCKVVVEGLVCAESPPTRTYIPVRS